MSESVVPHSFSEAAATLAGAAAQGRPVHIVGGATKLAWGGSAPPNALQLHTSHLSRVIVHEDGVTATINAGTPLVRAQGMLGRSGMMLAVDPQLGLGRNPAATVGGVSRDRRLWPVEPPSRTGSRSDRRRHRGAR